MARAKKETSPQENYKKVIIKRMKALGTYKPEFEETILRTASLYAQKDEIESKFSQSGGNTVITHTNKAGATNPVRNPFVLARDDVYTQILAHEKELGLTPAALKRINDGALTYQKSSTLSEALKALSG